MPPKKKKIVEADDKFKEMTEEDLRAINEQLKSKYFIFFRRTSQIARRKTILINGS